MRKFGPDADAVATIANPLKLGSIDASNVTRLVIVRKNGGVRTMKVTADISKFIREHAPEEISDYPGGMIRSVKPGSDFASFTISVKSPA